MKGRNHGPQGSYSPVYENRSPRRTIEPNYKPSPTLQREQKPHEPNLEYRRERDIIIRTSGRVSSARYVRRNPTSALNNVGSSSPVNELQRNQRTQRPFTHRERARSPLTFIEREEETMALKAQIDQENEERLSPRPVELMKIRAEYGPNNEQELIEDFRVEITKEINKLAQRVYQINQCIKMAQQSDEFDRYQRHIICNYITYLEMQLSKSYEPLEGKTNEETQDLIIDILEKERETQAQLGNELLDVYEKLIAFEHVCKTYYEKFFNEQQFADELIFRHKKNLKIAYIQDEGFHDDLQTTIFGERRMIADNIGRLEDSCRRMVPGTEVHRLYQEVLRSNEAYQREVGDAQTFLELQGIQKRYANKLFIRDVLGREAPE